MGNTWSKKALTWLYIEDITSKHRVPAEPLHPACATRRPAKRRVLTPPRARKTQYDFGGKFHPHLQRIGNTEKARLLEVDVYLGCFNWRQRRIDCLMSITLLSSPNSSVEQVDWPHSHTPTNHKLTAHVADKLCRLIVIALWAGKTEKSWGQHLLQVGDVLRHRVNWKRVPSQLQATGTILRQQPSQLNPCPSVCYVLVLTKEQGKETRALSKNLAKAFDDYLAKEGCLEDLFSNKPSGTINPVYLPQTTPEQHKECVNQKNTVYLNSCPIFYPAT